MAKTKEKTMTPIEKNISETIARFKKQGTTGCSVGTLRQCTSTKGVNVPIGQYNTLFCEAAFKVAKQKKFRIFD